MKTKSSNLQSRSRLGSTLGVSINTGDKREEREGERWWGRVSRQLETEWCGDLRSCA